MAKIIYSGNPGSLPHTFDYIPNSDTPIVLQLTGSAWTSKAHTKIGLFVEIERKPVVEASVWSNGPSTHRSLNAGLANHTFPIVIADGNIKPVSITINIINGDTNFDVNDSVTLIEM